MVKKCEKNKDPIIRIASRVIRGNPYRPSGRTGGGLFVMRTRKQQIEFHIKSDDYFGSLATTINFAKQTLEKDLDKTAASKKRQIKTLDKVKDDLLFLQENYQIIKKCGKSC